MSLLVLLEFAQFASITFNGSGWYLESTNPDKKKLKKIYETY